MAHKNHGRQSIRILVRLCFSLLVPSLRREITLLLYFLLLALWWLLPVDQTVAKVLHHCNAVFCQDFGC